MSDVRDPERDQVAPTPNDGPSCHDLVIEDIIERKAHGLRKYNSLLQPHNGRSFLQDIYEELLDAVAYVRGKLEEERDASKAAVDRFGVITKRDAAGNATKIEWFDGRDMVLGSITEDLKVGVVNRFQPIQFGVHELATEICQVLNDKLGVKPTVMHINGHTIMDEDIQEAIQNLVNGRFSHKASNNETARS